MKLNKPILVRNLYFTCPSTGLLHFLVRVKSNLDVQIWLRKVVDENEKKLLPEIF